MSLTLNPILMLLVFAIFIALIFLLNSWLYRPILELMQRRERLLSEDSSTLVEIRFEIDKIKSQTDRVLHEAREQASKIKEEAIKEAQHDYNERFSRAKAEIENRFFVLQKEIEEDQIKIYDELKAKTPLFSKAIKQKFHSLGEGE